MRRSSLSVLALAASTALSISCKTAPAEPEPTQTGEPKPAATPTAPKPAAKGAPAPAAAEAEGAGDPHHGSFTLAEATKDLPGKGPLVATIVTGKGTLQCKLLDDKAPITVANFVGLATGKRAWRDPNGGAWVHKPAYDGTTFHRVIKGFMIQGGDPKGDGTGEPGYVIKDEAWDGAKHDKAGQLCMANRGPNTNGAQFFVTDAAAEHLDKPNPRTGQKTAYTIFGECAPLQVVHDIAGVDVVGDRPTSPVPIKSVKISREAKK